MFIRNPTFSAKLYAPHYCIVDIRLSYGGLICRYYRFSPGNLTVIIYCSDIGDRLRVMYRAQEKGMTSSEYVYIFYDMLPNVRGNTSAPWDTGEDISPERLKRNKEAFYCHKQVGRQS